MPFIRRNGLWLHRGDKFATDVRCCCPTPQNPFPCQNGCLPGTVPRIGTVSISGIISGTECKFCSKANGTYVLTLKQILNICACDQAFAGCICQEINDFPCLAAGVGLSIGRVGDETRLFSGLQIVNRPPTGEVEFQQFYGYAVLGPAPLDCSSWSGTLINTYNDGGRRFCSTNGYSIAVSLSS